MRYGKAIELFLVNGTADSLITAELSNWNGKAIKIPRIEVPACDRDDFQSAGVYFLFCKEDDGTDSVYIGEAENVKDRLLQHLRDYQSGKEPYYWNTAVVFIGRDLNKALIRYLENGLVELARASKRYKVLTKNTFKNTVMKESQIAVMQEFMANIKILINALGYKVLEPLIQPKADASQPEQWLHIKKPDVDACGQVTAEGFVLKENSSVSTKPSAKALSAALKKLRDQYFQDGHVKDGRTTQDILFTSSSAAAGFAVGYSISGPATWMDESGKTLKQIESAATNDSENP